MRDSETMAQDVVLVEPCFAEIGHVQLNRGFVAIVREAFPNARISFACSPQYKANLAAETIVQARIDEWIEAPAWVYGNYGPREFARRARWLREIFTRARDAGIKPTHVVILGSSGPILWAAFIAKLLWLPRRCKLFAFLHGNSTDLVYGWQSRNPIIRLFSFRTSIQTLPLSGVKVIALERSINSHLRELFPRLASSIVCIPLSFDDSEAFSPKRSPVPGSALRVLYLGQATLDKGFGEFIRLAEMARQYGNSRIEFRAAGAVRNDTRHISQAALTRSAGERPIDRRELLAEVNNADLVFMWQSEYYDLSPSGILLDCISLGVPILGRRRRSIVELEANFGPCGLFAEDIESLYSELEQMDDAGKLTQRLLTWQANLSRARADREPSVLGAVARNVLES